MKPTTKKNFKEILKTIQASKQKALQQVNTTLIKQRNNIKLSPLMREIPCTNRKVINAI